MIADTYCRNCESNAEVVFDCSKGTCFCSQCGSALGSRVVKETSKWRSTSDGRPDFCNPPPPNACFQGGSWGSQSRSSNSDPDFSIPIPLNACSGRDSSRPWSLNSDRDPYFSNPYPPNACSEDSDRDFSTPTPPNASSRGNSWRSPDRSVASAFKSIGNMSDRLKLKPITKDRAREIFRRLEEKKCIRGRRVDALAAACVYIACRQESKPRTLKEISSSSNGGATGKEIGRAKEFITKQLRVDMGESMEMGTIQAGDYLQRFCSNLSLTEDEFRAVQETVGKSEEFDIRRCPISVAAAVIFMITQLSDLKKPSLRKIADVTTVSEGTIRNAYRDLFPQAEKIIPEWFVEKKDLKSLCSRV